MNYPEESLSDSDVRVRAAKGLVASIGEVEGLLRHNVGLSKLNLMLDADLSDPGIRFTIEAFAGLYDTSVPTSRSKIAARTEEPAWTPEIAKSWLLSTDRATESDDGLVLRKGDTSVHLSLAGLTIAQGHEPRRLSEAYAEVTDNERPLDPDWITRLGYSVFQEFTQEPEQ